jgi:PKD repeat protein
VALKLIPISVIIALTAVNCRGQFRPDDLSGLVFWVRADSAVTTTNGTDVAMWEDVSQSGHNCEQPVGVIQPDLIPNSINGLPVISFDGSDDFMVFPEVSDIRTAFWVVAEDPLSNPDWPRRSLLGHSTLMYFLRGDGGRLWDSYASSAVVSGSTRLDFQNVNGTATVLPNDPCLVSLVTSDIAKATHLTMDLNIYGRTWWGDIAEIILYNEVLDEEELLAVETYLADKYTPSFSGFDDIAFTDRFCDTTLCAPSGMVSYLWSDGSTEPCLTIHTEGNYSVQITDEFGRMHEDDFNVSYPGDTSIPDTLICAGAVFTWNTGLAPETFTLTWSDGTTDPVFQSDSEGIKTLEIADHFGCFRNEDFVVEVDPFPLTNWLSESYQLCSGNLLSLTLPDDPVSITWNDNSHDTQISVDQSGTYSVELINSNGCISTDNCNVEIIGSAPDLSVIWTPACEGSEILFSAGPTDLNITDWQWDVGNGPQPGTAQFSYIWDQSGIFELHLTAQAPNGCLAELYIPVQVYAPPSAEFIHSLPCAGTQLEFVDVTNQDILLSSWDISGTLLTGDTVHYTFPESSSGIVTLQVTDSHGCEDVATADLFILPAPSLNIDVNHTCQGDLTEFSGLVELNGSGPVNAYTWDFGDGTGSSLSAPNHFYGSADTYLVRFSTLSANGCSVSVTREITLTPPPIVDFTTGNACVGEDYLIESEVQLFGDDEVISYAWVYNGSAAGTSPEIELVFPSDGLHTINLSVVTTAGCQVSVQQQIPVWQNPVADFTWQPVIGEDLYTYQFINESSGTNLLSEWTFGSDTGTSSEVSPTIQFDEEGSVTVQLLVTSLQGCSHEVTQEVAISAPTLDLQIASLDVVSTGEMNKSRLRVQVRNTGSVAANGIMLTWQGGGELEISEDWEQELGPGEEAEFTFQSAFDTREISMDYLCVSATAPDVMLEESSPEDNVKCATLEGSGLHLYPPFPNPGDDHLFVRCVTPVTGDVSIRIFDERGMLARDLADYGVKSGFHQYFLNISDLADGTYALVLSMGNQRRTVRFVKTHL